MNQKYQKNGSLVMENGNKLSKIYEITQILVKKD